MADDIFSPTLGKYSNKRWTAATQYYKTLVITWRHCKTAGNGHQSAGINISGLVLNNILVEI